jgi:hypothetical protein
MVEAFTAMKLTNPYTYLRNATGNTLAMLTRAAEKTAAGPIDFLKTGTINTVRRVTGNPERVERSVYSGELPAEIYGWGQGIKEGAASALQEFQKIYKGGVTATSRLAEVQPSREAIPGMTGRIIRIPYNLLSGTDMFFRTILKTGASRSAAYRQAAKEGLSGIPLAQRTDELFKAAMSDDLTQFTPAAIKDIRKYAGLVADEFTFQRQLGDFAKGADMMRKNLLGRIIVPFFKTPVNIGKFITQRSPLISFFSPRNFHDVFVKGGPEATEALSRIMVGHTVGAAMVLHALDGNITGALPKNKAEADAWGRLGIQPYSIKVGDKYYSYLGYDPASTQLAAAADLASAYMKRREELPSDTVAKLGSSIVRNLANQPYLQGISGLLDALNDPERQGGRFISQVLSGLAVPTGVAALARAQDPIARAPKTVMENTEAKIPGLSQDIRPRRNVWGDPIVRDETPYAPVRTKTANKDPFELALNQRGITIGFPAASVNGRKLTPDEYDQLLAIAGPQTKMHIKTLMSEPAFGRMSLPDQLKEVHQALETYREPARQLFVVPSELRALGFDPKAIPADKEPMLRMMFNMPAYKTLPSDQAKRTTVSYFLETIQQGGAQ